MLGRRKHIVGLSIGSQKIAVAKAHITTAGITAVDRLGIADTPPGAIENDRVVDASAISRVVRDLLASNDIKTGEVSLTIPAGSSVITRLLTLPSMPRKDMLEVLRGEVENYAVLSGDVPVLDFQTVTQKVEAAGERTELLLVAVPKGLVDPYISAVGGANLKLSAIETIPLAVLRTLTHISKKAEGNNNIEPQPYEPTMLMAVEENSGTVIIAQNETVQFIHSIEIGASRLRDGTAVGDLANEIISSVSYYQTAFPESGEIRKVVLFIDGTDSAYICRELGRYVNVPVVEPLLPRTLDDHIRESMVNHGLSAYAAIGSAIRTTISRERLINLIPVKKFEVIALRKQLLITAMIILATVLLSTPITFLLKARTNSIREDIASMEVAPPVEPIAEVSSIEADATRLKAQIDQIKASLVPIKRVNWIEVLPEIGTILPKNAWLNSFSWRENSIATFDGYSASFESVFKFIDTLTDSLYFDSVKLVYIRRTKLRERPILQFQLQCNVQTEALVRQETTYGTS